MKIDLHMHTTNSDGSDTVQQLVDKALKLGIDIISITDHDNVNAYCDLKKTDAKGNLMVIKGVELSFEYNNGLRHMLGYGIDESKIKKFLDVQYLTEKRKKEEEEILRRLTNAFMKNGFSVERDIKVEGKFQSEAYTYVCRSVNQHKDNIGKIPSDIVFGSPKFYWDYCRNPKSDYYIGGIEDFPDIKQVVQVIHNAGGLAFLAHPFMYGRDLDNVDKFIQDAVASGIDGIEIKHSENRVGDDKYLLNIAEKNNLFTSGGTDYHGKPKPNINLLTGIENNVKINFKDIEDWYGRVSKVELGNINSNPSQR